MSNVVKVAYRAYTRPRCQVSVYRTIGPLILNDYQNVPDFECRNRYFVVLQ